MRLGGGESSLSPKICSRDECNEVIEERGLCHKHYQSWWRKHKDSLNRPSVEERFWGLVDTSAGPDACWPWGGALDRHGYGRFYRGKGYSRAAHRTAYEFSTGNDPGNLQVDHLCWNPKCCNPRHLRAVTHSQNQQNRKGAPASSRSGIRGVHPYRKDSNKWVAIVKRDGKRLYKGKFDSPEAAAETAKQFRLELLPYSEADKCD
jgi:hypothetical protein